MIRRPPRSTPLYSSAASDVYKRQSHYSTCQYHFIIRSWKWSKSYYLRSDSVRFGRILSDFVNCKIPANASCDCLASLFRHTAVQRPQSHSEMNCLSAVTVDEVARQIKLLPPKSSPSDCLPVSLLKASVDVMAPLLAQLANLSFGAGVFPSRYKVCLLYTSPSPRD